MGGNVNRPPATKLWHLHLPFWLSSFFVYFWLSSFAEGGGPAFAVAFAFAFEMKVDFRGC
jgi:hypothetical protein